ncbi:MAG: proton-conducting membrane transporter [Labilithrix sp.]|nr:proton-conducting membrane transporter [Labilithrix sp.]MCW5812627.1 proton-conducting membrane transporter [Labilithrix sp.]
MTLDVVVPLAVAAPAVAAFVLGAASALRSRPISERTVVLTAMLGLSFSFAAVLGAIVSFVAGGLAPLDVRFGTWYRAGDYGFPLAFLFDGTSAAVSAVAAVLLLATARFSASYLHREPGFLRFYLLVLVFAAGMQLLLVAGSLDLLFAGWELVGIASVLLVAFFHERAGPVRAAIRVLVTYRLCDVGFVLAAVLVHRSVHNTLFSGIAQVPSTKWIPLCLLVAAMGKSAQLPVGGWLPRAMEGPTASSAIFYGGLSVHAGVVLLVRAAPLYAHEPIAAGAIVLVGLATAIVATLSGQVSPDAKTSLAYATIAQVGLMFVECGLGFHRTAIVHLCAHAVLRYFQFLRTPAVIQRSLERRAALGNRAAAESVKRWDILGAPVRRFVYRLALERFEVEQTAERLVARPILAISARLDRIERKLLGAHDD